MFFLQHFVIFFLHSLSWGFDGLLIYSSHHRRGRYTLSMRPGLGQGAHQPAYRGNTAARDSYRQLQTAMMQFSKVGFTAFTFRGKL